MKKFFLIVVMLSYMTVWAQTDPANGNVEIRGDPRIDSLVKRHIAMNKKFPGIDGYRVMIFFDSGNNSKDSAKKVIERFHEKYPKVPAYLSYHSPYYRVRVGNFREKMKGERFLNQIKGDYPNAWVIQTTIEPPRLEPEMKLEKEISPEKAEE
ncbi:MAG: SPOR domain-containing protein [Bacteroidales bacterium]|nr:SPOR domain-containing protein [Bacteroidales bacterium]MCF8337255.1 SPOR domain-containing protein [Bacteroidales bacterium]